MSKLNRKITFEESRKRAKERAAAGREIREREAAEAEAAERKPTFEGVLRRAKEREVAEAAERKATAKKVTIAKKPKRREFDDEAWEWPELDNFVESVNELETKTQKLCTIMKAEDSFELELALRTWAVRDTMPFEFKDVEDAYFAKLDEIEAGAKLHPLGNDAIRRAVLDLTKEDGVTEENYAHCLESIVLAMHTLPCPAVIAAMVSENGWNMLEFFALPKKDLQELIEIKYLKD